MESNYQVIVNTRCCSTTEKNWLFDKPTKPATLRNTRKTKYVKNLLSILGEEQNVLEGININKYVFAEYNNNKTATK